MGSQTKKLFHHLRYGSIFVRALLFMCIDGQKDFLCYVSHLLGAKEYSLFANRVPVFAWDNKTKVPKGESGDDVF